MKLFTSFVVLFAGMNLVWGAMPICARNYINDQGVNFCERWPEVYTYVQPLTPKESMDDKQVCTRIYADFYCSTTKEYAKIKSLKKGDICVMNFNQPPVANYCSSVPQFYSYIVSAIEE